MSYYKSKCVNIFSISLYTLLILMFVFTTSAPASSENPKEEVKEAAEAIGSYTVEQKNAAVAKAGELMEKLDDKIDVWEEKMEANWDDLKESSQENYRKSLRKMRQQRNELSEWYGSMKHSSSEAWNEVKEGFSNAYDGLVDAYSDSEKNISKDQ